MVGPTATGKTALGVALAEQFGGEIISADSMQIYKGLDVGTAKVTPEKPAASRTMPSIFWSRTRPSAWRISPRWPERWKPTFRPRKAPILVGGTGLYVQSFLYGVRFTAEKAPDGLRSSWRQSWPKKARLPCTKS